MHFTILDENVSQTMNGFLIIANVINIIYNVPQILKTYKTKSTRDFSSWFISLRIFGNIIWVAYAIEVDSMLMLINNIVTVASSLFIAYYKILEYIGDKEKADKLEEIRIKEIELLDQEQNNAQSDYDYETKYEIESKSNFENEIRIVIDDDALLLGNSDKNV